jgi:hypothetical protein
LSANPKANVPTRTGDEPATHGCVQNLTVRKKRSDFSHPQAWLELEQQRIRLVQDALHQFLIGKIGAAKTKGRKRSIQKQKNTGAPSREGPTDSGLNYRPAEKKCSKLHIWFRRRDLRITIGPGR